MDEELPWITVGSPHLSKVKVLQQIKAQISGHTGHQSNDHPYRASKIGPVVEVDFCQSGLQCKSSRLLTKLSPVHPSPESLLRANSQHVGEIEIQ